MLGANFASVRFNDSSYNSITKKVIFISALSKLIVIPAFGYLLIYVMHEMNFINVHLIKNEYTVKYNLKGSRHALHLYHDLLNSPSSKYINDLL